MNFKDNKTGKEDIEKAKQVLNFKWEFDTPKTIILLVFFILIVVLSINIPNII